MGPEAVAAAGANHGTAHLQKGTRAGHRVHDMCMLQSKEKTQVEQFNEDRRELERKLEEVHKHVLQVRFTASSWQHVPLTLTVPHRWYLWQSTSTCLSCKENSPMRPANDALSQIPQTKPSLDPRSFACDSKVGYDVFKAQRCCTRGASCAHAVPHAALEREVNREMKRSDVMEQSGQAVLAGQHACKQWQCHRRWLMQRHVCGGWQKSEQHWLRAHEPQRWRRFNRRPWRTFRH